MYGHEDSIKATMPLTYDHLHCIRIHKNRRKSTQLTFINENKSMRMMGEMSI